VDNGHNGDERWELDLFRTRDPLGFAGGDSNLYRYCDNDPVNFTDPRGLFPEANGADPGVNTGTQARMTAYQIIQNSLFVGNAGGAANHFDANVTVPLRYLDAMVEESLAEEYFEQARQVVDSLAEEYSEQARQAVDSLIEQLGFGAPEEARELAPSLASTPDMIGD